MPPIIDKTKCNGCGVCFRNCPGDLFILNKKRKMAEVSTPRNVGTVGYAGWIARSKRSRSSSL